MIIDILSELVAIQWDIESLSVSTGSGSEGLGEGEGVPLGSLELRLSHCQVSDHLCTCTHCQASDYMCARVCLFMLFLVNLCVYVCIYVCLGSKG